MPRVVLILTIMEYNSTLYGERTEQIIDQYIIKDLWAEKNRTIFQIGLDKNDTIGRFEKTPLF